MIAQRFKFWKEWTKVQFGSSILHNSTFLYALRLILRFVVIIPNSTTLLDVQSSSSLQALLKSNTNNGWKMKNKLTLTWYLVAPDLLQIWLIMWNLDKSVKKYEKKKEKKSLDFNWQQTFQTDISTTWLIYMMSHLIDFTHSGHNTWELLFWCKSNLFGELCNRGELSLILSRKEECLFYET